MIKRFRLSSISLPLLLCLMLVLVSACTSLPLPGSGGSSTPAPGSGSVNGPTVQMPPTQTACPAANTARAAVMRHLALGQLQNLVYIYNEVPQNTSNSFGHLRRYDVSNGHKAEVVSSGLSIDQAQISADGQWILFLSIPDPRGDSQHAAMLQLVRMDGEGLQTLYCFPTANYTWGVTSKKLAVAFQWSVDQKSILISMNIAGTSSHIFLLDVASGAIRQLFQDQNDSTYYYSQATWLDNTHFYIIKQGTSGPTPPATIYLEDAGTATVANPGLVQIVTTPTRMSYYSLDSSYDGTLLYSSYCLMAGNPFSTNIQVGPARGGTRHTIYQEQPSNCVEALRAYSQNSLLLLMQVASGANNANFTSQIWKMNLLGDSTQALATLTSSASSQTGYTLNTTSQYPWSNVSRDGGFYALQAIDPVAINQTVLVGSLKGGAPIPVAVTNPGNSSVSLAGWTTL